jgi:hypothetical protein
VIGPTPKWPQAGATMHCCGIADQNVREQCRGRHPACNRALGRSRLQHLIAGATSFGRVVRTTRNWAGTQSSISLTLSPMR